MHGDVVRLAQQLLLWKPPRTCADADVLAELLSCGRVDACFAVWAPVAAVLGLPCCCATLARGLASCLSTRLHAWPCHLAVNRLPRVIFDRHALRHHPSAVAAVSWRRCFGLTALAQRAAGLTSQHAMRQQRRQQQQPPKQQRQGSGA